MNNLLKFGYAKKKKILMCTLGMELMLNIDPYLILAIKNVNLQKHDLIGEKCPMHLTKR